MVVACGYCFVCLCNCFIGWFVDLMGDVCWLFACAGVNSVGSGLGIH